MVVLLQIFSWFWQWNNVENRLIFGKVKACHFSWATLYNLKLLKNDNTHTHWRTYMMYHGVIQHAHKIIFNNFNKQVFLCLVHTAYSVVWIELATSQDRFSSLQYIWDWTVSRQGKTAKTKHVQFRNFLFRQSWLVLYCPCRRCELGIRLESEVSFRNTVPGSKLMLLIGCSFIWDVRELYCSTPVGEMSNWAWVDRCAHLRVGLALCTLICCSVITTAER